MRLIFFPTPSDSPNNFDTGPFLLSDEVYGQIYRTSDPLLASDEFRLLSGFHSIAMPGETNHPVELCIYRCGESGLHWFFWFDTARNLRYLRTDPSDGQILVTYAPEN